MPANAILSDKGEKTLFKEGVAIDFVRAAFSHLKAIPVDQGGQMLLKRQMSDRTQTSWMSTTRPHSSQQPRCANGIGKKIVLAI